MADSAGHKVPKAVDKHKYPTMINRTTSESIRLGDTDKILNHPTSLSASVPNPRKKTSFQITSVTVGSHTSNDGGDDSADDLDESHTDDISRMTDFENETPSYSEDTFSKDDVFFNSSTSLGTAPVIPTSSQYGLAIVSTPDGCGNVLNSNSACGNNIAGNELHVSVADNVINLGLVGSKHLEGDMRDLHAHTGRNERFKVVKIESTEPFKRGRWMCMDYLDHTMSQQQQSQTNVNAAKTVESNDITVNQFTGTDSGIGMSDNPAGVVHEDQVPVVDQCVSIGATNIMQDHQTLGASHQQQPITSTNSVSPGQTMQCNVQQMSGGINQPAQSQVVQQSQSLSSVSPNQQNLVNVSQTQSLPPQQIQQVIVNSSVHNQQPLQQPVPQMPQSVPIQHVHHTMPQPTPAPANIPQQFQQPQPTLQQQIPQQPPIQQQQPPPTVLQQQPPMQQMQQHIQHQHGVGISVQQQSVPVSQPMMQSQPQPQMQQIPQQPPQQMLPQQLHQPSQAQHIQHATIPQHSIPGAGTQLPQQAAQPPQPQTYQPPSQPMMQPGITHQPPHIPMQTQPQPQYYTTTQPIQGASLGAQPLVTSQAVPPTSTLQTQPQQSSSTSLPMQQTYTVTSVPQQPPQQMSIGHTVAPTTIQHVTTPQIPAQVNVSSIQPPSTQAPVVNTQPTSQGATLPQQPCYISPPIVSSGAPTQVVGGSQTFASSAVTVVPSMSVLEPTPAFASGEVVPNDPVHSAPPLDMVVGEVPSSGEDVQPSAEDAESASGTSAVAIDNKIEQAMDLVKSHLMFAVREEVEVLKEKIAELMDRINQLELENTILKANATQETLAQLSASTQPPASSAP